MIQCVNLPQYPKPPEPLDGGAKGPEEAILEPPDSVAPPGLYCMRNASQK
jgi:hypothetical protein